MHFERSETTSPTKSIVRWFLVRFLLFSLICLVSTIPLILFSGRIFSQLEKQKSYQKLSAGVELLDTSFASTASASQALYNDSRFYSLHYSNSDLNNISVTTQNQMRDYIKYLTDPCTLIQDCALQIAEHDAITPSVITFNSHFGYYPFYFEVDDLSYSEWLSILEDNNTGYLPACRVSTPSKTYDALIYSIKWSEGKYFYACFDLSKLAKAILPEENFDEYRFMVSRNDGSILYSNLDPKDSLTYQTVSQNTSSGGLNITVYIPQSILTSRMQPLYTYVRNYLLIVLVIFLALSLIVTRTSSRPLLRIIQSLEDSSAPPMLNTFRKTEKGQRSINAGFNFIYNQIQSYETQLTQYQATIEVQEKVLQSRHMEKALHGTLVTDSDFRNFALYFPHFPQTYRLLLLGITEYPSVEGNIYPNVMAIVQCYLQQFAADAYMHQLTDKKILIIVDESFYHEYHTNINALIDNINKHEPCYHAWSIVSKPYEEVKDLTFAYLQINDLLSRVSTDSLTKICCVSEFTDARKTHFQISDTSAIYTAITSGNTELALHYVNNYADQLKIRSVYEMFYSILLCIKQEYADILMDIRIPSYRAQTIPVQSLTECVTQFCQLIRAEKDAAGDSFADQVRSYIDQHYSEEALCSASLEDHFKCSFVKIRKSFSKEFGSSISAYIESKRMALANELLLQNNCSVSEVCQKCGYTNYNTFLKAYRRTYGMTPSSAKNEGVSAKEHHDSNAE